MISSLFALLSLCSLLVLSQTYATHPRHEEPSIQEEVSADPKLVEEDLASAPLESQQDEHLENEGIVPEEAPAGPSIPLAKKESLKFQFGDSSFELIPKVRMEAFIARNTALFNNDNPTDRILIPGKFTLDFISIYKYGQQTFGHDAIRFRATIRTKGTFGDPDSIASTAEATIKDLETVVGSHSHPLARYFCWVREAWIDICLNDAFHVPFFSKEQRFTVGIFPFSLGRGISLGSSYAVDPDFIGYYSPSAVDQFAPGARIYGDLSKTLGYDLYFAITQNRSDTFSNVNAQINGQLIGHRYDQARGFGKINWIVAGRFRWTPVQADCAQIYLEPYALYNDEREQRVEFLGDANGKLGTFGLAMESQFGDFEFGFDAAFNIGRQQVLAVDRNTIVKESREGTVVQANSHVKASAGSSAPDISGKKALFRTANQQVIDVSAQGVAYNGQPISSALTNDINRFRSCYNNVYKGKMAVMDMAYTFRCFNNLKVAATAGVATGDENPNKDLEDPNDSRVDGDYRGFIGLQETYSGKRVQSAFVLSGAGSLPRVLSFPSDEVSEQTPSTTSRFTNIIFVGGGFTFKGQCPWSQPWSINPNVLAYWQQHRTKFFDKTINESSPDKYAARFLGVEYNVFFDVIMFDDFKGFIVASAFVPGSHYKDIRGKPINRDQAKYLDALSDNGVAPKRPLLGDNAAFFINAGFEYKF